MNFEIFWWFFKETIIKFYSFCNLFVRPPPCCLRLVFKLTHSICATLWVSIWNLSFVASCLRGAFPPVDFLAVCLVLAIFEKILLFSINQNGKNYVKICFKTIERRRWIIWLLLDCSNWGRDWFPNPSFSPIDISVWPIIKNETQKSFLALLGKSWQGQSLCSGHSSKTAFQSKKVIDNWWIWRRAQNTQNVVLCILWIRR